MTVGWWAGHAARAARDHAGAGHAIDRAWTAELECDAILTADQVGGDVFDTLSEVRLGLAEVMGWVVPVVPRRALSGVRLGLARVMGLVPRLRRAA